MTPELRWLSDPTVFAVNRLDAHSDHLCCRTLDEAESGLTSVSYTHLTLPTTERV